MNAQPSLTVVVIVLIGGAALQRCLASIQRWPVRIVVVGRIPEAAALRTQDLKVIESDASVPQRRALGAEAVNTEWLSFCEDTCEPKATWWQGFVALRSIAAHDAWSGPITIDEGLAPRFAALAAHEYGEFAPARWQRLATAPGASWRPVVRLAGLNLVYRAAALPRPAPAEGLIETELHEGLRAAERPLAMHGELAVLYHAADHRGATLRARFAHGRVYGGGLRQRRPPAALAMALLRCAALPAVLFARGWAGLPRTHRARPASLGWLAMFACAWSAGEARGLLTGRGDSLQRWH